MSVKIKDYLLTFLILVIIGILFFFGYYYFKLSPKMLLDSEDKEVLELFEYDNVLSDLELESRYAFDKIYYSAVDEDFAYIFSTNGKLIETIDINDLQYDKALDVANSMFANKTNNISLAVYNKVPVYVVSNNKYDVFIDFYSFEEVFKFRKGIGNE